MQQEKEEQSGPERIQAFLATLPAGIKEYARFMVNREDGLLYPSTAIRFWQEVASKTDDGRTISASPSHWEVVGWTQGRGWLASALHKHTGLHYETWSLTAFQSSPGPHMIDCDPPMGLNIHGKQGRYTEIEEQDVRDFAIPYAIDYFHLHPSNHHFIEILDCGHHGDHHANWACRVKFSQNGDIVKLLIHSTIRGLEVFAHHYEEDTKAPIFRQLVIDGEDKYLKPLNPDLSNFKMRNLEDADIILAVLIEARTSFL